MNFGLPANIYFRLFVIQKAFSPFRFPNLPGKRKGENAASSAPPASNILNSQFPLKVQLHYLIRGEK
jgi:hypothetical protein